MWRGAAPARVHERAAAEFAELEKAYRVLSDASARGALDDYLAAKAQRAQRQSQETDKRRKLREELERREKEVRAGPGSSPARRRCRAAPTGHVSA